MCAITTCLHNTLQPTELDHCTPHYFTTCSGDMNLSTHVVEVAVPHLPLLVCTTSLVATACLDIPEHLVYVQLLVSQRDQLVLTCTETQAQSSARAMLTAAGHRVHPPNPSHDVRTVGTDTRKEQSKIPPLKHGFWWPQFPRLLHMQEATIHDTQSQRSSQVSVMQCTI